MNTISETLLLAIDVLVNNSISKLQYDKTLLADIYSVVNLDTGEYKIKYSGNIVSAFASDISKSYKVGDSVYITIPEGDLSNKKLIIAKVGDSLSYGELVSLSNSIKEVSPTLDKFYDYDASAERGIVAGAPAESSLSHWVIYEDIEGYHGLFLQYSNQYELIRILASFLTRFHCEHTLGNYGLEIEFFTKGDTNVSYKLDLSSFNGDPYTLSVYSPQSVIIKAQPGYLTGIKSIKFFEENFIYDRYVEAGLVTDKENRTDPNIFVKDISLAFVERKDLTDTSYYLEIATPQGNSFTSNITSLDLVARLIYLGESILDESSCVCKWYKRDLSIMLGDELYDKDAGVGWSPIDGTSFGLLTLNAQDITYQSLYKLVVIYNESVILSDEILITNLNTAYSFELMQNTVGDEILLLIVNNLNNEDLVGDWYLSYPDGSYSFFSDKKNLVDVTNFLLYSSVVFYCGVYNVELTEIIAVLLHTISSSDSENDISISYDGEDSFRYDANGDVAVEDAEKERTLLVVLTWRDGVGTSYRVEWIGPDGQAISANRYTPNQSMIENLWVDNNNILHYTIKLKYKVNYNNNTITVRIITIDGQLYDFRKEILFLKDGDLGTNGTTYVATIRPYDVDTGLKISGIAPLIYRDNEWRNELPLRCYVYKDGELINNDSHYDLSYNWTGVNVNLNSNVEDRSIASGEDSIIFDSIGPYVKAQVTINDRMNGRSYDIYCSYPIDVAVGFSNQEIELLNIESIPSYIKYTSSGINPSFYSNNILFLYGEEDYTSHIISLTGEILTIEQDNGLYYLKPASSFIFENNSIALLRCAYSETKYLYHPVILYLDTYGNEAINGWDGQKIVINEEDEYILAPLVGAGIKDSANRFTGVVMGLDSGQKRIGLYGYLAGINTFGLMENGQAYFGAKSGGGLIVIDGTSALLYGGGNSSGNTNGMIITLADLFPGTDTEAININNGVFKVYYNGKLVATGADINGIIKADSGYIGGESGWTIAEYKIYSGTGTSHVELNSNPSESCAIWSGSSSSSIAISSKFAVTKEGLLYAKYGNIGGWEMLESYLLATNGTVGMASRGNAAFWAGNDLGVGSENIPAGSSETKFLVTRDGKLYCSSADISGKITADSGEIAGWKISNDRLQNAAGTVYLSSSKGLQVGDNFIVTDSGTLIASNVDLSGTISANKGTIGGWSISKNLISAEGTVLDSKGTITCNNGSIGGWGISTNGISKGYTTLTSGGLILSQEVRIYMGGNLYLGCLGYIEGRDDAGATDNIGIKTENSGLSIILSSLRNIALNASGAGVWIRGNKIHLNGTVDIEGETLEDMIKGIVSDMMPSGE